MAHPYLEERSQLAEYQIPLPILRSITRIASGAPETTVTDVYELSSLLLPFNSNPPQALEIENLEVTDVEWPRSLGLDGLLGMNSLGVFERACFDFSNSALELHVVP
jgi:hypothetical protein